MTDCYCEYCSEARNETLELHPMTNTDSDNTIDGSDIPYFGEDLAGVTSDDALLENAHRDFCFDSATEADADDLIGAFDPEDEDNYDAADEGNPVDCLD